MSRDNLKRKAEYEHPALEEPAAKPAQPELHQDIHQSLHEAQTPANDHKPRGTNHSVDFFKHHEHRHLSAQELKVKDLYHRCVLALERGSLKALFYAARICAGIQSYTPKHLHNPTLAVQYYENAIFANTQRIGEDAREIQQRAIAEYMLALLNGKGCIEKNPTACLELSFKLAALRIQEVNLKDHAWSALIHLHTKYGVKDFWLPIPYTQENALHLLSLPLPPKTHNKRLLYKIQEHATLNYGCEFPVNDLADNTTAHKVQAA